MPSYWDDPRHATWRRHHEDGEYGGWMLAFTAEWRQAHLPPPGDASGLLYDLLDVATGEVYRDLPIFAYYDEDSYEQIFDADWKPAAYETLSHYLYGQHHCGCHREPDAQAAGMPDTGLDCTELRKRLRIVAVHSKGMPGLILYSETLTEDELAATLRTTKPEET